MDFVVRLAPKHDRLLSFFPHLVFIFLPCAEIRGINISNMVDKYLDEWTHRGLQMNMSRNQ